MKRGNREVTGTSVAYENERFRIVKYDIIQKDMSEGIYYTIEKKNAVYVIAMNDKKEIYLLREFRFPSNREILNVTAGAIEKEHTPEQTAHKELLEETGLKAGKMEFLGQYVIDPGSQGTLTYAYLATDLDESNVGTQNAEFNEDILEVVKFPIETVKQMIIDNKIQCACTLSALNILFLKHKL